MWRKPEFKNRNIDTSSLSKEDMDKTKKLLLKLATNDYTDLQKDIWAPLPKPFRKDWYLAAAEMYNPNIAREDENRDYFSHHVVESAVTISKDLWSRLVLKEMFDTVALPVEKVPNIDEIVDFISLLSGVEVIDSIFHDSDETLRLKAEEHVDKNYGMEGEYNAARMFLIKAGSRDDEKTILRALHENFDKNKNQFFVIPSSEFISGFDGWYAIVYPDNDFGRTFNPFRKDSKIVGIYKSATHLDRHDLQDEKGLEDFMNDLLSILSSRTMAIVEFRGKNYGIEQGKGRKETFNNITDFLTDHVYAYSEDELHDIELKVIAPTEEKQQGKINQESCIEQGKIFVKKHKRSGKIRTASCRRKPIRKG